MNAGDDGVHRATPPAIQLGEFLDAFGDLVHTVSPTGALLFANAAWRRALGYSAHELAGLNILDVLEPECRSGCTAVLARLRRGEPVDEHAVTFRAKDGQRVPAIGRTFVTSSGSPESLAIHGVFRRAENLPSDANHADSSVGEPVALRRDCDERFVRLTAATQDAIAEFDAEGTCIYASEQHRGLVGLNPLDLLQRSLVEFIHPDDLARVIEDFRIADQTGDPARSLMRFRHADGSYRWFETTGSWYSTTGGERHLVSVSRDVSDRIRSETELRRSETRYRAILENSIDMISIVGRDGTITFQDAIAGQILGYELADIGHEAAADFVHPEDRARAFEALQECVETPGKTISTELRVRHRNGTWRWISAWGRNLLGVEGIDGIMITSRDVTEQRDLQAALERSEAELHQAQKMEALGRLAGGVAHDFNNLLSVINCSAELIADAAPDRPVAVDYARTVLEAGARAAGLTRQLLAFSRKQTFSPRRVDLNAAVNDIAKMLRRVIGEDVRLHLDLAPNLPLALLDPTQLDQVVMNLAVNARDAMPTGGVLTITTSSASAIEGGARLTVADTGHGMDRATQARVFEPFFTTKPSHKGTGLGLSMVYGVVMQSGGRIDVESELGRGSRFILDFVPAAAESPSTAPIPTAVRHERGRGASILVVEDDSVVCALVRRVLELRGYRVTTAACREEALTICYSMTAPPDLVLSDVILPDGSGPALIAEIQGRWPDLRVLLMSGYVGDMLDARGLESCGADLLEKPFSPESLARAVDDALEKA